MIEIEILSVGIETVSVVFYYRVPTTIYSPLSVDVTRDIKAVYADAADLQDLKDGKLIEVYKVIEIPDKMLPAQVRNIILAEHKKQEAMALKQYEKLYGLQSYVGFHMKNGVWTPPQ